MLELINVYKSIDSQAILKNINLKINSNELVSILGPSGSGKSTLLNIMGLLIPYDSGKIIFNNTEFNLLIESEKNHFRNRKLGFVFQFHNLLGEFTGEENILMPLYIRNEKISNQTLNNLNKLVELLGLGDLIKKLPSQLSGGEQQRIAIARALITEPELILADEPTGNLDDENAQNLYHIFLEIKKEYKNSIVMVTHNEKLTKNSDQIIRINSGIIS
ncbi:MAG: hypothetical protein RIR51_1407 [Bacteroidota bacterium]|jgi:lipoprotein-releasing system ATP-binding protein